MNYRSAIPFVLLSAVLAAGPVRVFAAPSDVFCQLDDAPPATRSQLSIDLPAAQDPAWQVVVATPPPPNGPIGEPVAGSLKLAAAVVDRAHYAKGDTVVLDLQTGVTGATISVDFSALDSTYAAGSESVAALGNGRYRVKRRIGSFNSRPAGVYPLAVTVRSGSQIATSPAATTVTYLPRGRGVLEAPAGRFLAPAPRNLQTGAQVAFVGAQVVPATRSERTENQRFAGTLRLEVSSAAPLEPGAVDLEIVENGRDGHWQVPLTFGPASCGGTGCRSTAEVPLERGGLSTGTLQLSLNLRLTIGGSGGSGGTASAPFVLPNLGFTALPFDHTHRLEGRLRFRFQHRVADIAGSLGNADYPQYAEVSSSVQARPIGAAEIVLQDACGHRIKGSTADDGTYSFEWTPVNCGQGTLTVWSIIKKPSRNVAVGAWLNGTIDSFADLTTESSDYLVYSYTRAFNTADAAKSLGGLDFDVDVPETETAAKAFFMLERASLGQGYYRDIPGVGTLPKLNIIYTPGAKPADAPADWEGRAATYVPGIDPGFVWIPAQPDYGWNNIAVLHEVGHYFHRHSLRGWEYGRFSEPLATVQAGVMAGSPWFDKFSAMETMDAQANYKNGAFRGAIWEMCDGCEKIDHSYGWEQRVFWDLYDGDEGDEPEPLHEWVPEGELDDWLPEGETGAEPFEEIDLIDGGGSGSTDADDHVFNQVLIRYLGKGSNENASYVDRGIQDVDLVDALDGMICLGHATAGQVDTLVNDAMGFGYDFGGPASCPW